MNRTKSGLLLLSLGLVSGCSGGGRAGIVSEDSQDAFVEVFVLNRTEDVISVSVQGVDRGGPPQLFSGRGLGRLAGGQRGMIMVPHRLRRISLSIRVLEQRLDQRRLLVDRYSGPAVDIGPGDRLEWEIGRVGDLYSVQLTAHDSPDPPLRVSREDGEGARAPRFTSERSP